MCLWLVIPVSSHFEQTSGSRQNRPIFSTKVVNQNTGFTLSCPFAEQALYKNSPLRGNSTGHVLAKQNRSSITTFKSMKSVLIFLIRLYRSLSVACFTSWCSRNERSCNSPSKPELSEWENYLQELQYCFEVNEPEIIACFIILMSSVTAPNSVRTMVLTCFYDFLPFYRCWPNRSKLQ